MNLETAFIRSKIRSIVVAEDDDRIFSHMKIDAWRSRFARLGLVETNLGSSSLLQVELLAQMSAPRNSCTVNMNGKSLIFNRKGTPVISVSPWKFNE
ncbi:hypothetical protein SLA2020_072660 [Shorea laevis]